MYIFVEKDRKTEREGTVSLVFGYYVRFVWLMVSPFLLRGDYNK